MIQLITDNYVAVIILIVFVVIQIVYFIKTLCLIEKINKILPSQHSIAEEEDGIVVINSQNGYNVYNEICSKINLYATENSDSINFEEIKDITDRITDKEFEFATSKTAFPMYIGLMGTYIGIIYGLYNLIASMGVSTDNMFGTSDVYLFIGGVIVSMMTSLIGLGLTTWSNNKASKTYAKIETQKNEFFSFLQTQILPKYPSTIAQTLKKEFQKAIGSLKKTIGALDGTVKSLNTDLQETFTGITNEFGESLGSNLNRMQTVVSTLTDSSDKYVESMKKQDAILSKLNSNAFTQVLERISNTLDKCEVARSNIEQMQNATENVVLKQQESASIQENLINSQQNLLNSQQNYNQNVKDLQKELNDKLVELHTQLNAITISSQERMNVLLAQPSNVFDYIHNTMEQFKKIEEFVESVTTQHFEDNNGRIEYINNQLRAIENANNSINSYLGSTKNDLNTYLESERDNIMNSAHEFVASWNRMFTDMAAHGAENPLTYLHQLEGLKEELTKIESAAKVVHTDPNLIDTLNKIHGVLDEIKNKKTYSPKPVSEAQPQKPIVSKKKRFRFFGIFKK